MEKKPVEKITAAVAEEQIKIETSPTNTIEEAQVSLQSEIVTAEAADNVMKTRH